MWPFQNTVGIVGWVEEILPSTGATDFIFRLLQSGYHEHFHSAIKQRDELLAVEVRTYGPELGRLCRRHLERGHRVQVVGTIIPFERIDRRLVFGIEALSVERAEPLNAFRYVNHRWQYELRPATGEATC